jgi:hypothetical protein
MKLNMTPEETGLYDWCCANLEDVDVAEIQEEAEEYASREINAPIAAEKLLELLVTVMVRNADEARSKKRGHQ